MSEKPLIFWCSKLFGGYPVHLLDYPSSNNWYSLYLEVVPDIFIVVVADVRS